MLSIQSDIPLALHTTLAVGGNAEFFVSVDTHTKLREAVTWARERGCKVTILGGGSNVLVSDAGIRGLVIRMSGVETTYLEEKNRVLVTVSAGKEFDALVEELVEKNLWGLENLSGIPGTVGATPVQNVGAYGVEVSDQITSLTVYDLLNETFSEFSNTECQFSYRHSKFKDEEPRRFVITDVTFALSKIPNPKLSYNDLERFFKAHADPTLKEIRNAVLMIRSKKFPDWKELGTAGSFFKNPILSKKEFDTIRERHPSLPGFVLHDSRIKVPLGFILDKILNLKGYTNGNVGLYDQQALVLVNHGHATAKEIQLFANDVVMRVKDEIGISVEWEVTAHQ